MLTGAVKLSDMGALSVCFGCAQPLASIPGPTPQKPHIRRRYREHHLEDDGNTTLSHLRMAAE